MILGQAPDKRIIGLSMGANEAERNIADIARNDCTPAIPVSIETYERDGKRLAIVEVRRGFGRPHFDGKSWVRVGSSTRRATEAEIMLMRAAHDDRKVALVTRWFNEGRRDVIVRQLPGPGEAMNRSPVRYQAKMVKVTPNWVVLDAGGKLQTFPFVEFNVGYDDAKAKPEIRYHGGT